MRYSVRLNDQAAADLADIVLFIARDNPAAAEKLGLALVETAFSLATFPYRGQQMKIAAKSPETNLRKVLDRLRSTRSTPSCRNPALPSWCPHQIAQVGADRGGRVASATRPMTKISPNGFLSHS